MPTGFRDSVAIRVLCFSCVVCMFCVLTRTAQAQGVEGYRFIVPTVEAAAGDSIRITVKGEHEDSAQGFSFATRYPAESLTIDRVHVTDTILEAINADFFEHRLVPEDGILIVGVLVDAEAPFEGELIPNVGFALDLFHIEATVGAEASGTLRLQQENGLGEPPVDNLYSVRNQAEFVTELGEGLVQLGGGGAGEGSGLFVRGDANLDGTVDISDGISFLGFAFGGEEEPACMAAADANDDEEVDISDPIFILEFLFRDTRMIPAPFPEPGVDPTPGRLSCVGGVEISG